MKDRLAVRLKWTTGTPQGGTWGEDPDGGRNDMVCVRVADFDRTTFRVSPASFTIRSIEPALRDRLQLRRGDLLLEKSGGGDQQPVGAVVVFDLDIPAVTSNFISKLTPRKGFDPRFLSYVHAHLYANRVNVRSIKQTTGIQNLDVAEYLNEAFRFPATDEQRAIAEFLDRETYKIDGLIERKGHLLSVLHELQVAQITPTIAMLSPDCPIVRLKFALERIEQGWSPQCENRPAELDEWGVLKAGCVNEIFFDEQQNKVLPPSVEPDTRFEIRTGDVLVSRANTRELLGSAAIVREVRPKLLLCDKLYRLSCMERLSPEYLVYYLRSSRARCQIESEATGTSGSMQNVGQDTLKNLRLLLPTLAEQKRICAYIDAKIENIKRAQTNIRGAIERLYQYRSALISAAVTGQLDVRKHEEKLEGWHDRLSRNQVRGGHRELPG